MKLVASKTSPYARKIRVLLAEKQLAFEFVEESAWNAGTFSVTLVSCQVGPVSFSADAEHAATDAMMTSAATSTRPANGRRIGRWAS